MTWTPQRVDTLKRLWGEGFSAGECASRLGDITRNGVIGKVHRLGLAGRATVRRMKSPRSQIKAAKPLLNPRVAERLSRAKAGEYRALKHSIERKIETPKLDFEPIPVETDIPAKLFRLADWSETACQWPYTDPVGGSIKFGCQCERINGRPYCAGHTARAHDGINPRRVNPAKTPGVPMLELEDA